MSYQQDLQQVWRDGGPGAAINFLKEIFHHPDNQKKKGSPTDYLRDDDRKVTLKQGFDQLINDFRVIKSLDSQVDEILKDLDKARTEENDRRHTSQPFNAFVIRQEFYDYGSATIYSVNLEENSCKKQYDLSLEIVGRRDHYPDEKTDHYTFIYDLKFSNEYQINYQGEILNGNALFSHIRAAQYAQYASQIVSRLLERDEFANYPKLLPFRFVLDPADNSSKHELSDYNFEFYPDLTEESLAGHRLEKNYIDAAAVQQELSIEEKWLYLLPSMIRFDDEYHQLIDMLKQNSHLMDYMYQLSKDAAQFLIIELQGDWNPQHDPTIFENADPWLNKAREINEASKMPRAHIELLKNLGENYQKKAIDYVKRLLSTPLPPFPFNDLETTVLVCKRFIIHIVPLYADLGVNIRKMLQDEFDHAVNRIKQTDSPILQLLLIEAMLRLEFSDDIIELGRRWENPKYDIERIPDEVFSQYLVVLEKCIDEMPEEFKGWAESWDFVIRRIKGLREHGAPLQHRLCELMFSYQSSWDVKRLNEEFAEMLFNMGMLEPPENIIKQMESAQYSNIKIYDKWVSKIPTEQLNQFIERFFSDVKIFCRPDAWEKYLHHSNKGIEIFIEGITKHEEFLEIFEVLVDAIKKGCGPLLSKLAIALVDHYNRRPIRLTDRVKAKKIIALLTSLQLSQDLNEKYIKILCQAELLDLRFSIDNKEEGVLERLEELLLIYPQEPMLLFCRCQISYQQENAMQAADIALTSITSLASHDVVYQKAVLQYSNKRGRDLLQLEAIDAYALFRFSEDYFLENSYREGKYYDDQKGILFDPFYRTISKQISKWAKNELLQNLRSVKDEFNFDDQLRDKSLAELVRLTSKSSWNISFQIVKKLMQEPTRYINQLLQVFEWFSDDESHRLALCKLYWEDETIRPLLVADYHFQQYLTWFIMNNKFTERKKLARIVFSLLEEQKLYNVSLEIAKALPYEFGISIFKVIADVVNKSGDFETGLNILERYIKESNPKEPKFVLLTTNKAIFHFLNNEREVSEHIFDELFAIDWSRFDYKEDKDDPMNELLGGDLDAKIADEFWQYFALSKYNAACVYANVQRHEDAVKALREAWKKLPKKFDLDKIKSEKDFTPLKTNEQFIALCKDIEGAR